MDICYTNYSCDIFSQKQNHTHQAKKKANYRIPMPNNMCIDYIQIILVSIDYYKQKESTYVSFSKVCNVTKDKISSGALITISIKQKKGRKEKKMNA